MDIYTVTINHNSFIMAQSLFEWGFFVFVLNEGEQLQKKRVPQ